MSHNDLILKHLSRRKAITSMDAFRLMGCTRLAARIRDLREDGYNIATTMVLKNGKRFASYAMR